MAKTTKQKIKKGMKDMGLLCLVCITAIPFACYLGIRVMSGKKTGFRICGHRPQRMSGPVKPLPNPRRPLTPAPKTRDKIENQDQSLFFTKLTPEIRLQIYQEALAPEGNELLHVATTDQRLCSFRCENGNPTLRGWQHNCWRVIVYSDGTTQGRRSSEGPHPFLVSSLLCSCRRVYAEALDILYTHTRFHIRQTRTIANFPLVMVPDRLRKIRHLHLDVPLDFNWPQWELNQEIYPRDVFEYWEVACPVIRDEMEGLQTLRVSFGVRSQEDGDEISDETFIKLLSPLAQISHIDKSFLVEFHWRRNLDGVLGQLDVPQERLPFTVAVHEIGDQPQDPW